MDLLAIDLDDVDDYESKRNIRSDRARNAFLNSKRSYPTEPISLQPAWFTAQAELDSQDLESMELSLHQLYLNRKYQKALTLSLTLMNAVEAADTKAKTSNRYREALDMALRCCLKLSQADLGKDLAGKHQDKWVIVPGAAATAGQVYMMAGAPKDAVSAFLASLRHTVQLQPYLTLLVDAFRLWASHLQSTSPRDSDLSIAVLRIITCLQVAADKSARHRTFPVNLLGRDGHDPEESMPPGPNPEVLQTCLRDFGLTAVESEQVLALCVYAFGPTIDEEENLELRSVRGL